MKSDKFYFAMNRSVLFKKHSRVHWFHLPRQNEYFIRDVEQNMKNNKLYAARPRYCKQKRKHCSQRDEFFQQRLLVCALMVRQLCLYFGCLEPVYIEVETYLCL